MLSSPFTLGEHQAFSAIVLLNLIILEPYLHGKEKQNEPKSIT